jgi:hypothetical protein
MKALGRKARASSPDNFQNTLQGLPNQSRAVVYNLNISFEGRPKIFLMTSNPTMPLFNPPGDTVQKAWVTPHKAKTGNFECLPLVSSANPDL